MYSGRFYFEESSFKLINGKMVSVNKGDWDKTLDIYEKHKFNRKWIRECYKILKDEGTIWVSRNIA